MRMPILKSVMIVVLAATTGVAPQAVAQVKIAMPPPPAAKLVVHDAPPATVQTTGVAATTVAAIPAVAPVAASATEGQIALSRYANARAGTYDTYFNDGSYYNNGIRYVSYPNYIPQFVWGPYWGGGWWGGWGGAWSGCRW